MAITPRGFVQKKIINRVPYFVGFNTVNQPNPPYSLTNIGLIKRDINNQFATPMGSRVMLPNFGTRIFELLFDPFDEYTKNMCCRRKKRNESEVIEIINKYTYLGDLIKSDPSTYQFVMKNKLYHLIKHLKRKIN